MKKLLVIIKSGLFVLILYFGIILAVLLIFEMQPVQADLSNQPIMTTTSNVQYLRLTDALPQRDITKQRLAPLEVRP